MNSILSGSDALRVLPESEAARRYGINPSTWRRMLRAGETPSPVRLSPRRRGYLVADLEAWWAARVAERGAA